MSLTNAKETDVEAALVAVSSKMGGISCQKEKQMQHWRIFLVDKLFCFIPALGISWLVKYGAYRWCAAIVTLHTDREPQAVVM